MTRYVLCILAIVLVAGVAVAGSTVEANDASIPVLENPELGDFTVHFGDEYTVLFRQWYPEVYRRADSNGDGVVSNAEYHKARFFFQHLADENPKFGTRNLAAAFMSHYEEVSPDSSEQVEAKNKFWVRAIHLTGDDVPAVDVYANHTFSPKLGAFCYSYTSKGWAQVYGGARYVPAQWCEIELGVGGEQSADKYPWRVGSSLWVGNNKASVIGFAEYGVGGFWHRAVGLYKLDGVPFDFVSDFKVGLMSQQDLGAGPSADVAITGTPLKVWVAGMYDNGWTSLMSVRAEF